MSDLISRQAAIDAMEGIPKYFDTTDTLCLDYADVLAVLSEHLPSAQPEVLAHGEGELSAQPEQPSEIQDILDYLDTALHPIISPEHWSVYSELHDMISTLPSVQTEIIRCKDCRHRDTETGFCEGRGWPMQLVPDDGFCDKGERSEE